MPLLAKDRIKETLADSLFDEDTITVDSSRRLGAAAFDLLWAMAEQYSALVLEASWNPVIARDRLRSIRATVVEVRCVCPPKLARQRYMERSRARHWVHLDSQRQDDDYLWTSKLEDLSPNVVEVDTTEPTDISQLARDVQDLIGA